MASSSASRLQQPVLHNLVANNAKKHMAIGAVFAAVCGVAFYLGVNKPRRDSYRDFYAGYDAETHYARMRNYGYFQSVPVTGDAEAEEKRK